MDPQNNVTKEPTMKPIDFLISSDEDGESRLTNQAPFSVTGLPMLHISSSEINGDFTADDIITFNPETNEICIAAYVVENWALNPERTAEELEAARLFLRQWPDGPQIA